MFIKYTLEKYLNAMLSQGHVHISSFWHFRAHEDSEIGDPEEGQSGFMFRNDTNIPWEISPALLDAAAMSVAGRPRFNVSKTLMPCDESWIEAAGGFNTFMYSLSQAESPSTKLMRRLGYDAAVEIVDIEAFATHTASALRQHLVRELQLDRIGATRLRCVQKKVEYVDSKRRIVTPSTVDVLQSKTSIAVEEFFTKFRRHEYQSEFRIAYFMMNLETDKYLSLDIKAPDLYPVIVGDAGIPRIAKTLRRIDPSEFME